MIWFRQTPPCMVEGGRLHQGLLTQNKMWDTRVGKEALVRRSAVGLSADNRTLYIATSEATTAVAIALATQHAGASEVAALAVDGPDPGFVTIDSRDAGNAAVKPLIEGPQHGPDDYVRTRMSREFFYLTRMSPDAVSSPP